MEKQARSYLPAAGHDWLLPLYDPLQWLFRAEASRRQLLEQASIEPKHRVLDIGCGTGDMVVLVSRLYPEVEVVGLDPDPKALARARRKAERAGVTVRFDPGFSDELPYADASFDRVLSSFMLHHVEQDAKAKTLSEVRRVLKPGGSFHILDFASDGSHHEGLLARLLHGAAHDRSNFDQIPTLMREAGFASSKEIAHRRSVIGRIAFYAATAPNSGDRATSGAQSW